MNVRKVTDLTTIIIASEDMDFAVRSLGRVHKEHVIYVCEEHGITIGLMVVSEGGYINSIYVAKKARLHGVGSMLLMSIAHLDADVARSAVGFYRKNGFDIVASRGKYIRMRRLK